LHFCRLAGNSGVLPTVVLAEFYAIARRDAGRDVAELRLRELVDSGLEVVQLSQEAARCKISREDTVGGLLYRWDSHFQERGYCSKRGSTL